MKSLKPSLETNPLTSQKPILSSSHPSTNQTRIGTTSGRNEVTTPTRQLQRNSTPGTQHKHKQDTSPSHHYLACHAVPVCHSTSSAPARIGSAYCLLSASLATRYGRLAAQTAMVASGSESLRIDYLFFEKSEIVRRTSDEYRDYVRKESGMSKQVCSDRFRFPPSKKWWKERYTATAGATARFGIPFTPERALQRLYPKQYNLTSFSQNLKC